jgi:hypothetical protein
MGMQKRDEQGYTAMPDEALPGQVDAMGDGGNSCLTNQNEADVTACAWEDVPLRRHDDGSYTVDDDFSTVGSMYREEPPL